MARTKQQQLTTIGQRVEVEVTDFSKAGFAAGFPKVWVPGTVERVNKVGRQQLDEITVRTDDGLPQLRIIGKRGGNPTVRVLA